MEGEKEQIGREKSTWTLAGPRGGSASTFGTERLSASNAMNMYHAIQQQDLDVFSLNLKAVSKLSARSSRTLKGAALISPSWACCRDRLSSCREPFLQPLCTTEQVSSITEGFQEQLL